MTDRVRLSVQLPRDIDDMLEAVAEARSVTKGEVIRNALALFMVAQDAQKENKAIGIVDDPAKLDQRIVGLL